MPSVCCGTVVNIPYLSLLSLCLSSSSSTSHQRAMIATFHVQHQLVRNLRQAAALAIITN